MTDASQTRPVAPTTTEGFLADRLSFWTAVTRFSTRVVVGLVILLLLLWWWLV